MNGAERPVGAGADPLLVRAWLSARSVARGLPPPEPDHGGWRVETGGDAERRRFVFAEASAAIGMLGDRIVEPRIFIKLCGEDAALRALLPPRWRIMPASMMMVREGADAGVPHAPAGYRIDLVSDGAAASVRITDAAGSLAASGHAAEAEGVFVYDRIVTDGAHRRRGLGRAVMQALGTARRAPGALHMLVATEEGRALYRSIGWRDYSPYSSAVIASGD